MAILRFVAQDAVGRLQRMVLRQVLSDANYETEKLAGGFGPENEEARKIVRLIKAATIGADQYPLSMFSLYLDRHAGIDVWENEGGSVC